MFLLSEFCTNTANVWQLLGHVVTVIKIVIPLILIVLGMIDLGKAVISNDDKQMNTSVTKLVKRFVAAVVVFFVPTLVGALFNALSLMGDETQSDYNKCVQCLTNPGGECSNWAKSVGASLTGE